MQDFLDQQETWAINGEGFININSFHLFLKNTLVKINGKYQQWSFLRGLAFYFFY